MFHKLLIPRVPCSSLRPCPLLIRTMATVRSSLSHEERTAQEPREARLEPVTVSRIDAVNSTIRLIRLSAMKPDHTLKVQINFNVPNSPLKSCTNYIYQSKVPTRSMARRLHPFSPKSRRFHHNFHTLRSRQTYPSTTCLLRTSHPKIYQPSRSMALEIRV